MRQLVKIIILTFMMFTIAAPSIFAGTFTASNQDVTAYSASRKKADGSTRYTHSGKVPASGYGAVRKNASLQPHVPFGSTVKTPQSVNVGNYGTYYIQFSVQDTGVVSTQTYYAIDIWWGFCRDIAYTGTGATPLGCNPSTDQQFKSAVAFGEKHWTLDFFTP
jgi:hypothetical protein